MSASADDDREARVRAVIRRCQKEIDWYRRHKTIDRWCFYILQVVAVTFAGLTPVAVAVEAEKWLQATLPALAAIAVGLSGTFAFREGWARFGMAEQLLRSELTKFQARATSGYEIDLDPEIALRNFVERVETILLSEATEWRSDLSDRSSDAKSS